MEELFRRLLDLLPTSVVLLIIAIGAVAWVVKQLKPGSEYGDVLRNRTFQRASIFILGLFTIVAGVRFFWTRLRAADFRSGENGICVARFQDDGSEVLQRYTVEKLRLVISQDPSLANVRVESYPVTVTTPSEARSLANKHHAIATIWGSVISGFGANIATFEVTPTFEQQEIRKICVRFPDIDDFTQGMVSFVKTSISAISTSSGRLGTSGVQQDNEALRSENIRLLARLRQMQSMTTSSAPNPQTSKDGQERRFGIFIGINDYGEIGVSERFAANDARDMATAFRNSSAVTSDVTLLIDSQATRTNVMSALSRVSEEVGSQDQVWLYIAGLGYRYEPTALSYIALADTRKENLTANSLSSADLLAWIKGIKSKQVLVLLDACHSGFEAHRGVELVRSEDVPGRVFMAATNQDGLAFEEPSLGHGTFTYYLLQGLSGNADLTGSGYITPYELFTYIEQKMASGNGTRQTPIMDVLDGSADFTVAQLKRTESK